MRKNSLDVANNLITFFMVAYKNKYEERPVVNRGKMKFALADILQDWSEKDVRSFIEYYVRTDSQPDLTDFCRRYDEIINDKKIEERDIKVRKQLMSQTKTAVQEFRERYKGAE